MLGRWYSHQQFLRASQATTDITYIARQIPVLFFSTPHCLVILFTRLPENFLNFPHFVLCLYSCSIHGFTFCQPYLLSVICTSGPGHLNFIIIILTIILYLMTPSPFFNVSQFCSQLSSLKAHKFAF